MTFHLKEQMFDFIKKYWQLFVLIIFGFLLLPPHLIVRPSLFLDGSWVASINLAFNNNLIFGTDYIFTYGPLGFLHTRCSLGLNKCIFIIYDLFIIFNLLLIIRYVLKEYNSFKVIVVLFLLIFLSKGTNYYLLIFLFQLFHATESKSIKPLIMASLISVLTFYIKVNFGIVLNILFLISLIYFSIKKSFKFQPLLFLTFFHLLLLILSSIILNVDLYNYILSSLYIINSYNDIMFAPISNVFKEFQYSIIILGAFALMLILFYKLFFQNSNSLFRYILVAIGLFIIFKNSFVRADSSHIAEFYMQNFLLISLLWLFEKGKIQKYCMYLTALSFILSFALLTMYNPCFGKNELKSYLPYYYFKELCTYNNTGYKKEDSVKRVIPENILKKIKNSSVDINPTELSYAFINNLNYKPRPVPQSYLAYNEYLDKINAKKYSSAYSPEYILYSNWAVTTYPFWEESITKRVMLTNYLIDDTIQFKGFIEWNERFNKVILFKKNPHPLKLTNIKSKKQILVINNWYQVDTSSSLQYLFADVKYSLLGQIKRFLYQPPILTIKLKYDNDSIKEFRAPIPILKTGVLINKKVTNTDDAYTFYNTHGKENKNIIAFCFFANNNWGFVNNFESEFKTYIVE